MGMHRLFLFSATIVLCAPALVAQNRVSINVVPPAGQHMGMAGRHSTRGFSVGEGFRRRGFRSPFFYGDPYFYSDFYEPPEREYPVPQPPAQPVPAPVKNEPLPEPALLELRGTQWVRVTNFGESSQQALSPAVQASTQRPVETPPAVLIYRDGHSEEVSSYSIIGRMIYTKADYWTAGTWTRTIQIADLDIPATLKQNQQRGVKFELPSGPDEVMIRP